MTLSITANIIREKVDLDMVRTLCQVLLCFDYAKCRYTECHGDTCIDSHLHTKTSAFYLLISVFSSIYFSFILTQNCFTWIGSSLTHKY